MVLCEFMVLVCKDIAAPQNFTGQVERPSPELEFLFTSLHTHLAPPITTILIIRKMDIILEQEIDVLWLAELIIEVEDALHTLTPFKNDYLIELNPLV
jgi:hypothetical protein